MELKRRSNFRKAFTALYVVAVVVYLVVGFVIPADGTAYTIDGGLIIPSINLVSGVTKLELKDRKLNTPDSIVGSYSRSSNKMFLIGHSTTVFKNLDQVKVDDSIVYNNIDYKVVKMEIFEKSDINMDEVLKGEVEDTLVIMTCAGDPMNEHDATHRLIVTAVRV